MAFKTDLARTGPFQNHQAQLGAIKVQVSAAAGSGGASYLRVGHVAHPLLGQQRPDAVQVAASEG
jgi:hypothetical protein